MKRNKVAPRYRNALKEHEGKVFTEEAWEKLLLELNGTDFQIKAWQQLCKIPYAKTISYGEQAGKIGDKSKARAVDLANGSNPISIIIPCHRVIGSDGKLVGFGGGIDKKAY